MDTCCDTMLNVRICLLKPVLKCLFCVTHYHGNVLHLDSVLGSSSRQKVLKLFLLRGQD